MVIKENKNCIIGCLSIILMALLIIILSGIAQAENHSDRVIDTLLDEGRWERPGIGTNRLISVCDGKEYCAMTSETKNDRQTLAWANKQIKIELTGCREFDKYLFRIVKNNLVQFKDINKSHLPVSFQYTKELLKSVGNIYSGLFPNLTFTVVGSYEHAASVKCKNSNCFGFGCFDYFSLHQHIKSDDSYGSILKRKYLLGALDSDLDVFGTNVYVTQFMQILDGKIQRFDCFVQGAKSDYLVKVAMYSCLIAAAGQVEIPFWVGQYTLRSGNLESEDLPLFNENK